MNKIITHKEAAKLIKSGQTIMVGGFGDSGYPFEMIKELHTTNINQLTIIGNDGGVAGDPKGKFYTGGQVEKLIISYCGLNPDVSKLYTEGKLDIEFVPQGTLAERIRCGGCGLGGFLTPTGIGTLIEEDKTVMVLEDKEYILEKPLRADVAILKGSKADEFGNIVFNYTSKNYNPSMAMAADMVIAEVDEIVQVGEININEIMLSGIFVDYIVDNREVK